MTDSSPGLKTSKSRRSSNRQICVADFETTTDAEDCRVWSWGLVDIYDPDLRVDIDNTLDSFCDHVSMMESPVIYFHNLKFDGHFILDWLLRNGYSYLQEGRLMRNEFKCVISKESTFYSISVRWGNGNLCEFRDSYKKLPMTVSRIAKSFKLPILKGTIDYHAYRPVGHVITDDEAAYLVNDCRIVALAMRVQLDQGMTRMTVGADSLAEYKDSIDRKVFDRIFPVLCNTMDADIRRAYRGGWTYADDRFRGRVVERDGIVLDVNSLYPSVMYDRVLPWGEPVFCDEMPVVSDEYPLFICTITFTAELKPDHVPCIQIKGSTRFNQSAYQVSIPDPVILTCTNIDLALWREHYDLDILCWDGAWLFKGAKGMFNTYIDKWMQVKATSEGGMREIAKLHLNSLYGKFATNPNVTGRYPILDDKDCVKLVIGPDEIRNPVYTPMGVFITAYARDVTIRAAQANYHKFAYADTDSLHLFNVDAIDLPECDHRPDTYKCYANLLADLDIDPFRLGAWKHEMTFDAAIYVHPKCYSERHRDRTICTCGVEIPYVHETGCGYGTHIAGVGIDVADKMTFRDFYSTHQFDVLRARVVPGGVVLAQTKWELNDAMLSVDRLPEQE